MKKYYRLADLKDDKYLYAEFNDEKHELTLYEGDDRGKKIKNRGKQKENKKTYTSEDKYIIYKKLWDNAGESYTRQELTDLIFKIYDKDVEGKANQVSTAVWDFNDKINKKFAIKDNNVKIVVDKKGVKLVELIQRVTNGIYCVSKKNALEISDPYKPENLTNFRSKESEIIQSWYSSDDYYRYAFCYEANAWMAGDERVANLDCLINWAEYDDKEFKTKLYAVLGPSGCGKSKLAFELLKYIENCYRDNWTCLWIERFFINKNYIFNEVIPNLKGNILIVVDDVQFCRSIFEDIMPYFEEARIKDNAEITKVRIVVTAYRENNCVLGEYCNKKYYNSITLNPLNESDLEELVTNFSTLLYKDLSLGINNSDIINAVLNKIKKLDVDGSAPLYALFITSAVCKGETIDNWGCQEVLDYIINREATKLFGALKDFTDPGIDGDIQKDYIDALDIIRVIATMCGGLSYDTFEDELPKLGIRILSLLNDPTSRTRIIKILEKSSLGRPNERMISGIMPDTVGMYFCLNRLLNENLLSDEDFNKVLSFILKHNGEFASEYISHSVYPYTRTGTEQVLSDTWKQDYYNRINLRTEALSQISYIFERTINRILSDEFMKEYEKYIQGIRATSSDWNKDKVKEIDSKVFNESNLHNINKFYRIGEKLGESFSNMKAIERKTKISPIWITVATNNTYGGVSCYRFCIDCDWYGDAIWGMPFGDGKLEFKDNENTIMFIGRFNRESIFNKGELIYPNGRVEGNFFIKVRENKSVDDKLNSLECRVVFYDYDETEVLTSLLNKEDDYNYNTIKDILEDYKQNGGDALEIFINGYEGNLNGVKIKGEFVLPSSYYESVDTNEYIGYYYIKIYNKANKRQ